MLFSCTRPPETPVKEVIPFQNIDTRQIDSLLIEMSLNDKIGQLVFYKSNLKKPGEKDSLLSGIARGHVGGVLLDDLALEKYIDLTDQCRSLSTLPLFFGTEEKVALHNQFSDVPHFPTPATLSAIDSTELHDLLERHYVQQCKVMGINFCFAPSLQKIEPTDSTYNYQCFESEPLAQLGRSLKMMVHLQQQHILAVGDSFSRLVYLEDDTTGVLDSLLDIYHSLAQGGLSGLLVDEAIYRIDTLKKLQTYFIQNYFHKNLKFNGLIVSKISAQAEIDELIHAGTDLFVTGDYPVVFEHLKKFVEEGLMTQTTLNEKVRKILMAKTWMNGGNLLLPQKPSEHNLFANKKQTARLASNRSKRGFPFNEEAKRAPFKDQIADYFKDPGWGYFIHLLYEKSIILSHNYDDLLPFPETLGRDFRIIQFGEEHLKTFKKYFSKYASYTSYLRSPAALGETESLNLNDFRWSSPVIILDQFDLQPTRHQSFIRDINELSRKTKVVLINFGNPLNLQYFDTTLTSIQIFERNEFTESAAAQLLFGGFQSTGRLPLQVSDQLKFHQSDTTEVVRLRYAPPEAVGIAPERLSGIDAIAFSAIDNHAFPGCQVVVAKEGTVIYSKTFGFQTYQKEQPVRSADLYDLASITKVAATTLAAMKLFEEGKIILEDPLNIYIDCGEDSKVGSIRLNDLMIHQSGLQAFTPIASFISPKDSTHEACSRIFCTQPKGDYTIQVAGSLFMKRNEVDTIWKRIFQLPVSSRRRYRYSDVNFILLQRVIETITHQKLNDYVFEHFYRPLGERRTLFKPRVAIDPEMIVPTEDDWKWRKELLRGYVHDESAALFGGVAGNAGLFSTAEELTVLFQMLLNGGTYGKVRYFRPETVHFFTSAKHGNRRGLGFDKPSPRKFPPYAREASPQSFGHAGFTGTVVWVDPTRELVFVFLSNRVNPNAWNPNFYHLKVRSRMHQVVYDALDSYQPELPEFYFYNVKG